MKLLQKLKSLILKPKPPEKVPVWSGQCACCGEDIVSYDKTYPEGEKVEHLKCSLGFSEAGKQRSEDRRQIDLYKRAIKELEQEKTK